MVWYICKLARPVKEKALRKRKDVAKATEYLVISFTLYTVQQRLRQGIPPPCIAVPSDCQCENYATDHDCRCISTRPPWQNYVTYYYSHTALLLLWRNSLNYTGRALAVQPWLWRWHAEQGSARIVIRYWSSPPKEEQAQG